MKESCSLCGQPQQCDQFDALQESCRELVALLDCIHYKVDFTQPGLALSLENDIKAALEKARALL